jgi:outer membrane lipoprotein-sorting protein
MRTRLMIATLILGLLGGLALAAELDGKGIVDKMADQTMSQSGVTDAKMIIIDKNGNQRIREMRMRTKEKNGLRNVVTTFLAPPDVRGTKFLVIEKKDSDDDQRIYLPALKRARKITSSNKGGSFMGSTFSYADLQSHDADQGTHTRLPDAEIDGHAVYVVETVPNAADDEIYSKLVYWVRQDNFLPIKGEFYDKKGKLWKRLEVSEVEQRSDGTWIAKKTKMADVQKGTATILELGDYEIGSKIDDAYFTERFLTDETME